jgi:putative nucleotidyltransferase with HDIG domain
VVHLEEAVVRLGFEQVYRLVAASLGARSLASQNQVGEAGQLWRHSVVTAAAAQLIARDLEDDQNLIFTAALLHDIGKIILADGLDQTYLKLLQEVEENQYSLLEAEKRVLGVQHSEVGGRLMARWKFPLGLVSGIWFHHHPAAAHPHERLAAYIYVGDLIAYLVGYGCGHHALGLRGRDDAFGILKLDHQSLPKYMMATSAEFASIRGLFQAGSMAGPAKATQK